MIQVFTTCTLKELCPEDKQKVAQLVKQVVELGKENQQLKAVGAKVGMRLCVALLSPWSAAAQALKA